MKDLICGECVDKLSRRARIVRGEGEYRLYEKSDNLSNDENLTMNEKLLFEKSSKCSDSAEISSVDK